MELNGVPLDGQPRIFVAKDVRIASLRLSQVLRGAGYDVVLKPDDLELRAAVEKEDLPPDLLLLQVEPEDPSSLDAIRELRTAESTSGTPILGVTAQGRSALDFDSLRRAGVAGVVDGGCIPEEVVSRVNRMLRAPHERRRHLRATTRTPVEVTAKGETTHEIAVSLSIGGMGISSARDIEVSTDLRVRFAVPEAIHEPIEVEGRATYVRNGGAGTRNFGVFFYSPCDRAVGLIHREVERLLSLQ
jgi:DNA-binding response OmpR family regulator